MEVAGEELMTSAGDNAGLITYAESRRAPVHKRRH